MATYCGWREEEPINPIQPEFNMSIQSYSRVRLQLHVWLYVWPDLISFDALNSRIGFDLSSNSTNPPKLDPYSTRSTFPHVTSKQKHQDKKLTTNLKEKRNDLKSLQWRIIVQGMVYFPLDDVSEVLGIGAHEINSGKRKGQHSRNFCKPVGVFPSCSVAYFLHLRRGQTPFLSEKFQPIACVRQVRRSHLQDIPSSVFPKYCLSFPLFFFTFSFVVAKKEQTKLEVVWFKSTYKPKPKGGVWL